MSQDTHFSSETPPQVGQTRTGTVAFIEDGDTLAVNFGTTKKRIRLSGIDAPEIAHEEGPGQPLGLAAKALLGKLVPIGTTVQVVITGDDDEHPRFIGIVNRGLNKTSKVCINAVMIGTGMAEIYTEYLKEVPEEYRDLFVRMQARAKDADRGIWSLEFYERPCEYRKKHENRPPAPSV